MKIRQGFVSNSSSSSFMCDVCGLTESGWDAGLEECEMYECEYGHTFCECHLTKDLENITKQDVLDKINDQIKYYKERIEEEPNSTYILDYLKGHEQNKIRLESVPEFDEDNLVQDYIREYDLDSRHGLSFKYCPICNFEQPSNKDLGKYLEKETKITRDEIFQEIKAINKRRRKLYDNEYLEKVCQRLNKPILAILDEVKARFGTYDRFMDFIK